VWYSIIRNKENTTNERKGENTMNNNYLDDFNANVTCEEVYTEDGYKGTENEATEWEVF
jgi:hypothetical protein